MKCVYQCAVVAKCPKDDQLDHYDAAAGATSFDGSSAAKYAVTLPLLDLARKQPDLFGASSMEANRCGS